LKIIVCIKDTNLDIPIPIGRGIASPASSFDDVGAPMGAFVSVGVNSDDSNGGNSGGLLSIMVMLLPLPSDTLIIVIDCCADDGAVVGATLLGRSVPRIIVVPLPGTVVIPSLVSLLMLLSRR
jgi:hypothetical protein